MNLDEVYSTIKEVNLDDEHMNKEDLKKLVLMLYTLIKKQNEVIFEFRNSCIRLENMIRAIENKLKQYDVYKNLCHTILDKINTNIISALWFLHSVKKKITNFKSDE